jgi:hypothetical protein
VAPVVPAAPDREETLVPDHLGHDLEADRLQAGGHLVGVHPGMPDIADLERGHEGERVGPVHPGVARESLFGGLFVPVSLLPTVMQDIAPYMSTYGVAEIARFPLIGGAFDLTWPLSVVLWTTLFAAAAAVLFRRDTRRV